MAISSKSKIFRAYALSELPLLFPYTHLSSERLKYFLVKIAEVRLRKLEELDQIRSNWASPDGDAPPVDDDKLTYTRCFLIKRSIIRYAVKRFPGDWA